MSNMSSLLLQTYVHDCVTVADKISHFFIIKQVHYTHSSIYFERKLLIYFLHASY